MTNEAPPPPPPPPDPRPEPASDGGTGAAPGTPAASPAKTDRTRLIGAIVLAIVAIWFIMANLHRTQITFWVVTVTSPMWLTLAGTFLAGMAATLLFTRNRKQ